MGDVLAFPARRSSRAGTTSENRPLTDGSLALVPDPCPTFDDLTPAFRVWMLLENREDGSTSATILIGSGETSAFVSRDPIGFDGGTSNLYMYAENAPTQFIDPLGLQSMTSLDLAKKEYGQKLGKIMKDLYDSYKSFQQGQISKQQFVQQLQNAEASLQNLNATYNQVVCNNLQPFTQSWKASEILKNAFAKYAPAPPPMTWFDKLVKFLGL